MLGSRVTRRKSCSANTVTVTRRGKTILIQVLRFGSLVPFQHHKGSTLRRKALLREKKSGMLVRAASAR
jgi:hypothetical protein